MLDGHLLVDAHVHVPDLGSSSPHGSPGLGSSGHRASSSAIVGQVTADHGPGRARTSSSRSEGVDAALLFCEYSPRATGYQRFDDLLPIVEHNPQPVPAGRERQPAPALPDRGAR